MYLPAGFEAGKVYQVIYTTTGAPVVGLGKLATRDAATFLRYGSAGEGNPLAGLIDQAYSFGVSQSGRFLRLFMYLGLNYDEDGRVAFDGFMAVVTVHSFRNQPRAAFKSESCFLNPGNGWCDSDADTCQGL